MMGVGGLMATAQVAPLADTFKISAAALTFALSLNPLANGARVCSGDGFPITWARTNDGLCVSDCSPRRY